MPANWLTRAWQTITAPIFGEEPLVASVILPGEWEYYEKKEEVLAMRRAEAEAEQAAKRRAARKEHERKVQEEEDERRDQLRERKSRSKLFKNIDEEEKYLAMRAKEERLKEERTRLAESAVKTSRRNYMRTLRMLSRLPQTSDAGSSTVNTTTTAVPSKQSGETLARVASRNAAKRLAEAKAAHEAIQSTGSQVAPETSNSSSNDTSTSNGKSHEELYREWLNEKDREHRRQQCALVHPQLDAIAAEYDYLRLVGKADSLPYDLCSPPFCTSCFGRYTAYPYFWRYLPPFNYTQDPLELYLRDRPWVQDLMLSRQSILAGLWAHVVHMDDLRVQQEAARQSVYSSSCAELTYTVATSCQMSMPQQSGYTQPCTELNNTVGMSNLMVAPQQSAYSHDYAEQNSTASAGTQLPAPQPNVYTNAYAELNTITATSNEPPLLHQNVQPNIYAERNTTTSPTASSTAPQEIDWAVLSQDYAITPIEKSQRASNMSAIHAQTSAFTTTHAFDHRNITSRSKWESVLRGHEPEFATFCQNILNTVVETHRATGRDVESLGAVRFVPRTHRMSERKVRSLGLLGREFDELCRVMRCAAQAMPEAGLVGRVSGVLGKARRHFGAWEGLDGREEVEIVRARWRKEEEEERERPSAGGAGHEGVTASSSRRPLPRPGGKGAEPIAFQMA